MCSYITTVETVTIDSGSETEFTDSEEDMLPQQRGTKYTIVLMPSLVQCIAPIYIYNKIAT